MVVIRTGKYFSKIVLPLIILITVAAAIFCSGRYLHDRNLAAGSGSVEIFDVGKGRVVKQVGNDLQTRREAEKLLKNITGLYIRFKPLPDSGRIVRIPLAPPAGIKNKWLNDSGIADVDVLFVLLPDAGEPYLLVLDKEQRPWFFYTKGSTAGLVRRLSGYGGK
jgi:hypothetical protein